MFSIEPTKPFSIYEECFVPQQRKHGQGSLLYMLNFKPIPNLNQRYPILTSQMSYFSRIVLLILTLAYKLLCATM